jgi:segregation and condensation protein B
MNTEADVAEVETLETEGEAEGEAPLEEGEVALEVAEPSALAQAELPQVLEALLLASQSPLSMAQLKNVTGMSADALSGALEQLAERYQEGTSGIVLAEAAGGWALRTSERQKAFVRRLLGVKPQRLTRAALETLALVAYRQPITRPEVEDVRGVDCGAVLKALLERRMLKIIGKKEEPGRPLLYATSKEFLEVFGLKSLTSLPTLREFQELSEESRTIVENETPEPVASGIEGLAELANETLTAKLEQHAAEDDEALADLEAAMDEAEARARKLSEQMDSSESTMAPAAGGDAPERHVHSNEEAEAPAERAPIEAPAERAPIEAPAE